MIFHIYMFDFMVLSIHVFECFNTLQAERYINIEVEIVEIIKNR